jgi:ubiquinone/menaquinone biosynthesis C-methylase UbiE
MGFAVPADAYDRFMGRYSQPLGPLFADFAGVEAGKRTVDVGCGPGALTAELVKRVGTDNVSAVDPSPSFVDAARTRFPEVDIRQATAEELPFEDQSFDAALAQLVVHFMSDPVAGLREMARVTRPGGVVAACVWDHHGGRGPISPLWDAASGTEGESRLAGSRGGHLTELFDAAGLAEIEETALTVHVEHPTFDEWWEPFTLGVGPAGGHVKNLSPEERTALRERLRERFPDEPFTIDASAWSARGVRP